jgi:hypothetical protein
MWQSPGWWKVFDNTVHRAERFNVKMLVQAGLAGLVLLGSGCTVFVAKETLYLKSAQDRATQEEVRQQLGKPHQVATSKAGDSIWVYQVYYEDPGPNNQWGTAGTWCDEYVLTFDKEGILRGWTHKSEGHGGELAPTYCVTDGFKAPS